MKNRDINWVYFYDNVIVIDFHDSSSKLPPPSSSAYDFTKFTLTAKNTHDPSAPTEIMNIDNSGLVVHETDAFRLTGPTNNPTRIRITAANAFLDHHLGLNRLNFKKGYTYTLTWQAGAIPYYFSNTEIGLGNNNSGASPANIKYETNGTVKLLNIPDDQHFNISMTMP